MRLFCLKMKLFLLTCVFFCTSAYAFIRNKTLALQCKTSEIILPDGRRIKDAVGVSDNKAFISAELMESILGKPVYWDSENSALYIGSVPSASVMSDKVKIYHYDYDSIRSFLYCPDARTNKPMTMAGQKHESGYYFSNVFSASFNLDGAYEKISGCIGCEDFKASDGTVEFYLDDQLIKSCDIKSDSLPEKITLPVKGGKKLSLVFSHFKPDTQIDFADVYIH